MRDFPEVRQDKDGAGVILKDRTGTSYRVVMDWSGPYPMILCLDQMPLTVVKESAP